MDKENKITLKMYEALCKKYEAEMAEAESSLLVYFTSPVGIGEHPQHIEEMDKLVDKIANAKDKLQTIQEFYKYY
jgi:methylaspartate ammonia-lyase